jgi:hypothetical protein
MPPVDTCDVVLLALPRRAAVAAADQVPHAASVPGLAPVLDDPSGSLAERGYLLSTLDDVTRTVCSLSALLGGTFSPVVVAASDHDRATVRERRDLPVEAELLDQAAARVEDSRRASRSDSRRVRPLGATTWVAGTGRP